MKKRLMKRVISMGLCSLLTLSSFSSLIYAEENYSNNFYADLNAITSEYTQNYPQYSEEITQKVNSFRNHDSYKEYYEESPDSAIDNICGVLDCYIDYRESNGNADQYADGISPQATGGDQWGNRYYVNVPLIEQDTNYYCGPACVYMTIEGIRNHMSSCINTSITNTQEAHAKAMEITASGGTDEGKLRNRLTSMLYNEKYLMDYSNQFSESEFITYTKNSLAKNGPVVLMIYPHDLSVYQNANYPTTGGYATSNHYVVVSSVYVNRSTGETTFTIKDPNNWNNGELNKTYAVSSSELYNSFISIIWMKWN